MTVSAVVVVNLKNFVMDSQFSRVYSKGIETEELHAEAEDVLRILRDVGLFIFTTSMESVWVATSAELNYAIVRIEKGQSYIWHLAGASPKLVLFSGCKNYLVNALAQEIVAGKGNIALSQKLHSEVLTGEIVSQEMKYALWEHIKHCPYYPDEIRELLRPFQRLLVTPYIKGKAK